MSKKIFFDDFAESTHSDFGNTFNVMLGCESTGGLFNR